MPGSVGCGRLAAPALFHEQYEGEDEDHHDREEVEDVVEGEHRGCHEGIGNSAESARGSPKEISQVKGLGFPASR